MKRKFERVCACFLACITFALLNSTRLSAAEVLEVAREYTDGGSYNKTWKGSGTPEEIRFLNAVILPKGDGTYCCGYTLTVALKVAAERGLLAGKQVPQIRKFQKQWYGDTPDSKESLCQLAVEELEIGSAVPFEEAQPGDFVQFWRANKSGHSVIFLDWVMENGNIVGMKYRSSQSSTDGIGDRVEYFADAPGREGGIIKERTHICRLDKGKQAGPTDE